MFTNQRSGFVNFSCIRGTLFPAEKCGGTVYFSWNWTYWISRNTDHVYILERLTFLMSASAAWKPALQRWSPIPFPCAVSPNANMHGGFNAHAKNVWGPRQQFNIWNCSLTRWTPPGGGGHSPLNWVGGAAGVQNLTLSQTARRTRNTPCHNIPY